MIRIHKPPLAPAALVQKGPVALQAVVRQALAGTVPVVFQSSVYGHPQVKLALVAAQHGKCAFCESKFTHVSPGDVEHFRPKAAVEDGGLLVRPGYFWLAYEWDNLYASCAVCNQRHKRNAFPVAGVRASYDAPNLDVELPALVDPGHEEPSAHIEFIDSAVHGKTARGQATIRQLGLDREPLRQVKANLYKLLLSLLGPLLDQNDAQGSRAAQDIVDELCAAMRDEAEYAAMNRCLIRTHPLASRIEAAC